MYSTLLAADLLLDRPIYVAGCSLSLLVIVFWYSVSVEGVTIYQLLLSLRKGYLLGTLFAVGLGLIWKVYGKYRQLQIYLLSSRWGYERIMSHMRTMSGVDTMDDDQRAPSTWDRWMAKVVGTSCTFLASNGWEEADRQPECSYHKESNQVLDRNGSLLAGIRSRQRWMVGIGYNSFRFVRWFGRNSERFSYWGVYFYKYGEKHNVSSGSQL
jgi:hypothetical protein